MVGVVVDRDAGDLHDAGLDRLDQAEVADHPGEERAFLVAGAGQEGRRGGQVVDGLDAAGLALAAELSLIARGR